MKTRNVILALALIAVCLIAWISFGSGKLSQAREFEGYIEQGDIWVEEGLYQRAIGQYQLALEAQLSEEVMNKIFTAYQLRYKEAPAETLEAYLDFLETAVGSYPANEAFVDAFVEMFMAEEKYQSVYDCLCNAIANGYDAEAVQTKFRQVRYLYKIERTRFFKIIQSEGGMYSVHDKTGRNAYSAENNYLLAQNYDYVGLPSASGTVVVTGKDSRLIDGNGVVLGIFDEVVTEAGIYSNGLVPACCNGVYAYYDEFAQKVFGDYQEAGKFQDGVAAVRSGSKWMLVDTSGKIVAESLGEIVLDYAGRHCMGGILLAKTSSGQYTIYDKDYEVRATLDCSDAELCSEDGLIAFCRNNLWGFANTKGEVVIEPQYEQARSFSNGVAAVCMGGLWGFIDKENNLVIDYQFYDAGYMDPAGTCPVCVELPEENAPEEELYGQATWRFINLVLGITEG